MNNTPTFLLECQSGYQEAEIVIKIIKRLKNNQNLKSCAILYRSHYQSRLFEEFALLIMLSIKFMVDLIFIKDRKLKIYYLIFI